jgi:hypothetical protein
MVTDFRPFIAYQRVPIARVDRGGRMSMAHLRDGLIVDGWTNWDTMALMQRIGALAAAVAGGVTA